MMRKRRPILASLALALLLSGCHGPASEAEMEEQVEIVHTNVNKLATYFGNDIAVILDDVIGCAVEIGDPTEEVSYLLTIPIDRTTFEAVVKQLPAHYPSPEWRISTEPDDITFRKDDLLMSATFRPRRDEVSIYGTTGCRR